MTTLPECLESHKPPERRRFLPARALTKGSPSISVQSQFSSGWKSPVTCLRVTRHGHASFRCFSDWSLLTSLATRFGGVPYDVSSSACCIACPTVRCEHSDAQPV